MAKKRKPEGEEPLEKNPRTTADELRKKMDAAEYKHLVMGNQYNCVFQYH